MAWEELQDGHPLESRTHGDKEMMEGRKRGGWVFESSRSSISKLFKYFFRDIYYYIYDIPVSSMRIQCRRRRSRAKDYVATTAVWRLRLHHVTFILVLLQIKTPCRPDDDLLYFQLSYATSINRACGQHVLLPVA